MVKAGDIILYYNTNSFISRKIKNVINSPFTHVAIAINESEIVESDGFIRTRKRNLFDDFRGFIVLRPKDISDEVLERVACRARLKKGTRYDYLLIFGQFLRYTFNFKFSYLLDIKNRFICSSLIDVCFMEEGIDLIEERRSGDVSPADFAFSDKLELIL